MKHRLIVDENDINVEMFYDICETSCGLISKMLRTDVINIKRNTRGKGKGKNTYVLTWKSDAEKDKKELYEQFVQALCRHSTKRKQKHSEFFMPKWVQTNNEKAYAYDLFKHMGFFGKEYRDARLELMDPLIGTSAGSQRNRIQYVSEDEEKSEGEQE